MPRASFVLLSQKPPLQNKLLRDKIRRHSTQGIKFQREIFLRDVLTKNLAAKIYLRRKKHTLFKCYSQGLPIKLFWLLSNETKRGKNKVMSVKRGDIYYADLSPVVGSEQGGLRPVLIIQNDIGNRYSPTVIAAAITSRMGKTRLPTHIDIYAEKAGLAKDSVILLEQIRTLDKQRLKEKMGHLDDGMMNEVNNAIAVSFGLGATSAPAAEAIADGGATPNAVLA